MVATMLIFAIQDGISQYLAREYNVFFIVMIRYWFFAIFVFVLCSKQPGGLRTVVSTRQPFLQIFRGALLAFEVIVMITSFTWFNRKPCSFFNLPSSCSCPVRSRFKRVCGMETLDCHFYWFCGCHDHIKTIQYGIFFTGYNSSGCSSHVCFI